MSTLVPDLTAIPSNTNIAFNNSYVEIDNAGRTLYARVIYAVNNIGSTLSPDFSAAPLNTNTAENNSFVEIDDAGRTLYAQAVYLV